MAKEIRFKNDKIYKLALEKADLLEEAKILTQEIQALEKKRANLGFKIQIKKDKIIPLIAKEIKNKLGEYEYATMSDVDKKTGEVVVTTVDALEEFKKEFKKK